MARVTLPQPSRTILKIQPPIHEERRSRRVVSVITLVVLTLALLGLAAGPPIGAGPQRLPASGVAAAADTAKAGKPGLTALEAEKLARLMAGRPTMPPSVITTKCPEVSTVGPGPQQMTPAELQKLAEYRQANELGAGAPGSTQGKEVSEAATRAPDGPRGMTPEESAKAARLSATPTDSTSNREEVRP